MEDQGFVYIMASRRNGTIYIGSAHALPKRAWEHRNGVVEGIKKKYGCNLLVWYEAHESLDAARLRERQMKEWRRAWKIREIEGLNPEWNDLYNAVARP
ncbi:GIY-YIG nuclease family protein [Sphingomonas soli]|uniref:GIY-YIG nuclease family protein n=1 Tax=Sphingomonas soli TaxID=266127 RepID=UPI000B12E47A|nr:GIY-YIG nuclease family protein [Sphingomonas soli]